MVYGCDAVVDDDGVAASIWTLVFGGTSVSLLAASAWFRGEEDGASETSLWRALSSLGVSVSHLLCVACFAHLQCASSLTRRYGVAGSFLPFLESTLLAALPLTFAAAVSEFASSESESWGWSPPLHAVHAAALTCATRALGDLPPSFVAREDPVAVDVRRHVRLASTWAPSVLRWAARGVPSSRRDLADAALTAAVPAACASRKSGTAWTIAALLALQETVFVDAAVEIGARVWGHAPLSRTVVTALTTAATACGAGAWFVGDVYGEDARVLLVAAAVTFAASSVGVPLALAPVLVLPVLSSVLFATSRMLRYAVVLSVSVCTALAWWARWRFAWWPAENGSSLATLCVAAASAAGALLSTISFAHRAPGGIGASRDATAASVSWVAHGIASAVAECASSTTTFFAPRSVVLTSAVSLAVTARLRYVGLLSPVGATAAASIAVGKTVVMFVPSSSLFAALFRSGASSALMFTAAAPWCASPLRSERIITVYGAVVLPVACLVTLESVLGVRAALSARSLGAVVALSGASVLLAAASSFPEPGMAASLKSRGAAAACAGTLLVAAASASTPSPSDLARAAVVAAGAALGRSGSARAAAVVLALALATEAALADSERDNAAVVGAAAATCALAARFKGRASTRDDLVCNTACLLAWASGVAHAHARYGLTEPATPRWPSLPASLLGTFAAAAVLGLVQGTDDDEAQHRDDNKGKIRRRPSRSRLLLSFSAREARELPWCATALVLFLVASYAILLRGCGGGDRSTVASSHEDVLRRVYGPGHGGRTVRPGEDVAVAAALRDRHDRSLRTRAALAGSGFCTSKSWFGPLSHALALAATAPTAACGWRLSSSRRKTTGVDLVAEDRAARWLVASVPLNAIATSLCTGVPALRALGALCAVWGTRNYRAWKRRRWRGRMRL